jgi:hypothetical protein
LQLAEAGAVLAPRQVAAALAGFCTTVVKHRKHLMVERLLLKLVLMCRLLLAQAAQRSGRRPQEITAQTRP